MTDMTKDDGRGDAMDAVGQDGVRGPEGAMEPGEVESLDGTFSRTVPGGEVAPATSAAGSGGDATVAGGRGCADDAGSVDAVVSVGVVHSPDVVDSSGVVDPVEVKGSFDTDNDTDSVVSVGATAAGETTPGDGEYRSGFVAVVGRPNVGKSTLINALIGTQVAIASSRPETTRKAIRGIMTTREAQLVLVDTPGIHRPRTLLGQRLNDVVDESLSDVDEVAFLLPADQEIGPGDRRILSRLRAQFATKHEDGTFTWNVPLIAIVTKIDELGRSALVDKLIAINEFAGFTEIVPVSAVEHDNLDELRNVLIAHMPIGPQMYPDDQVSEERPDDMIAELVRGAFLEELHDELPHSLAVVVDSIERPGADGLDDAVGDGKARVLVSVYVERDSQKPIIIGRKAEHLVRVRKKLRTAVNRIVGCKARLDLHVKVAKGWQSDPKKLERLGF